MTPSRTTALMNRLPRWFVEQARAVDALTARRQQAWEETRRRNNAAAEVAGRVAQEAQRAAAATDRDRRAWQDTVAGFSAR